MRTVGHFLKEKQVLPIIPGYDSDSNYESYYSKKKPSQFTTIVAMGDSFTNGGNLGDLGWKKTYPYLLSKKLEREEKNYAIVNLGLCEDTTLGVYTRLKEYYQKNKNTPKKPAIVSILVGAADIFHVRSDDLPSYQHIDPEALYREVQKDWVFNLRIYKMYRHIKLVLTHKYILSESSEKANLDVVEIMKPYTEEIKRGRPEKAKNILNKTNSKIKAYIKRADGNNEIIDEILSVYTHSIVYPNVNLNHYGEALDHLLEIQKELPGLWDTHSFRYFVNQTFTKQSKHGAQHISSLMQKIESQKPRFNAFKKKFKNRSAYEEAVRVNRLKVWDQIILFAKEKNIKLIIQNYPSDYYEVNQDLQKVITKHGVPFIDNHSQFKMLISKEGRTKYLADDDHATPLGYRMISENVKNKVLDLDK
jgi:lysophospholipase L1-like esterase